MNPDQHPYKYIHFQKENDAKKAEDGIKLNGNEIKKFYEETTASITTESNVQVRVVDVKPDEPKCPVSTKPKKTYATIEKAEREYFKAAQNNDLNVIKQYISNGFNINAIDSFNWSALMIAVVASNVDIIEFLLENKIDATIQDNAGNNALKLAFKNYNRKIVDLLIEYCVKKERDVDNDSLTNEQATASSFVHCNVCEQMYDENSSHLSSIVHLLNEYEQNPELKTKIVNYKLDGTNKGFQLLLKSGWSQTSGLGANEQGRMYPIEAKQKYDRLGIGSEQSNTSKSKLIILKKDSSSCTSAAMASIRSIKDIERTKEKEKKFERKFRRYFDSNDM